MSVFYASVLLRMGCFESAERAAGEALRVDRLCVGAHEILDGVKGAKVSVWHFRMLNDFNRNDVYRYLITFLP